MLRRTCAFLLGVALGGLATLLLLEPLACGASGAEAIPRAALKWRSTIVREVRYWWGMAEPRDTFAGQLHQESRYNEAARSPVGAQGLAQFMPSTAAWIAALYPADLQPANALDAHWAIRACVKYDRWIYDRFLGAADRQEHWGMALAGYNAGSGWIAKERKLAPDPSRWYGSTENICLRSASACAESRGYARNIWFRWRPLYPGW
jgi:soluble lytic murein transglycosylase-like protein